MKCPRCLQENPLHAKFCLGCGTPLSDVIAIGRPYADLQAEIDGLRRELRASVEQQAATSEILRVISRSPADLQSVFDAMVDSAMRLFRAWSANVCRFDGELVHLVATRGGPGEAGPSIGGRFPTRPTAGLTVGRCILDRAVIQIDDVETEVGLVEATREMARARGWRSALAVPMLRDGEPVGAIMVTRKAPGGFEAGSVELLQTFADQAVIAIEDVRLFTELQASNSDLTTALDQQTATSEILRVISQSPTDTQPVFDAIASSSMRLCEGTTSIVSRYDGELLHLAAHSHFSPEGMELVQRIFPTRPTRATMHGRAVLEGAVVHILDAQSDAEYAQSIAQTIHNRSTLAVPMLLEGRVIGAIAVARQEVRPFTDAQILLLQTFADQAVIAIENVRLFKELEARNQELTIALAQQTATSEVLAVISGAQTVVQPVFEAIVRSARRLCDASYSSVYRLDGQVVHLVAHNHQTPEAAVVFRHVWPLPLTGDSFVVRAIRENALVHTDMQEDPTASPALIARGRAVGHRRILVVPMARDGQPVGAIRVSRVEATPFAEQHIALLKTFADQAVIAIENVRLFTELQDRNRDLMATSEILRVISTSPTDVQPVLNAIAERAVELCGAYFANVFLVDGDLVHWRASHNVPPEGIAVMRATYPLPTSANEMIPAMLRERRTVMIEDAQQGLEGSHVPAGVGRSRVIGLRSWVAVPLLRQGDAIGALAVSRREVKSFSENEIAVLQTFADQAVIAIENVRLFRELQVANRDLKVASQHKSEFLANMSHELRTPLNAVIGFSEVLSEGMFGQLNDKQEEYARDIYSSGQHLLSLINDILDLSKIEAGRMELEVSEFHLPAALDNALTLVRERASRRGIALDLTVDERLGQIRADERKIRQVVLNLLSNAIKFTPEGGRIEVRAAPVDGSVEVSVTDTGVGIAPEDQEAIFEEFKQVGTAAKKVEGTGLGLALSRKFIELHGGRIWVKSELGAGSTFTFTVPMRRGGTTDQQ